MVKRVGYAETRTVHVCLFFKNSDSTNSYIFMYQLNNDSILNSILTLQCSIFSILTINIRLTRLYNNNL